MRLIIYILAGIILGFSAHFVVGFFDSENAESLRKIIPPVTGALMMGLYLADRDEGD